MEYVMEECACCGCELEEDGYYDEDDNGPFCEECAEDIGLFDMLKLAA
ncbi:hypothetical protein [Xanthomonas phage JGB6]|nr:hypothetical protein [Xanthomonas phage JGB6]